MKSEIRVLGIDDSPFTREDKGNILIVATYFRGGHFMDGLLSTKVKKDGNNSTFKIIQMINKSKFKHALRALLLDGIAVAGFNIIDIQKLNKKTNIPVIVIMRSYPNKRKILTALKKINQEKKFKLIEKAGTIYKNKKIHFQCKGIDEIQAKNIIDVTTPYADIPEPLRIAHIIAAGIIKGESRGRA